MATNMSSRLVLRRIKPRPVHILQVDKCIWTMVPRPTSPMVPRPTSPMVPRPTSPSETRDYKFTAPRHNSNRLLDMIMSTMVAPCLPGTNTKINQEMAEKLKTYSAMTPTSLSISELLEHGRRKCKKESFQFLRMCLPIRLANMIMELQFLPYELTKQPQFQDILHSYFDSFKKMLEFEMAENNDETHIKFMEYLIHIRKQHANTVPTMAAAMKGMIMESGTSSTESFQYFLDRLYLNRISIHLLISNYRELHGDYPHPKSSLVGIIDPDCDLIRVAVSSYEDAAFMCDREYMDHPKLHVEGFEVKDETREVTQLNKVSMAYIPSHLHHIFFEIFKNGMRATCEKNLTYGGEEKLDDIRCIIYKSKNDITIRISDVGGGINRYTVDHAFDYQYTTAKHVAKIASTSSSAVGLQSPDHPMHGLGYGLPLSRLYARYFQGDLRIASVDGYGTDVYIYLQALSDDATEHLPNFSQAAVHKLRPQSTKEADWIDKLSLKSPWRQTG